MVKFPSNVTLMYEQFVDVINFQILPKEDIYDTIVVPVLGSETAEE